MTLFFRLLIQSTTGKGFNLRLDLLLQCPDKNPNPRPPGRPSVKLFVNFHDPLQHCEEIKKMCRNPSIRQNIILFAKSLLQLLQLHSFYSFSFTAFTASASASQLLQLLLLHRHFKFRDKRSFRGCLRAAQISFQL